MSQGFVTAEESAEQFWEKNSMAQIKWTDARKTALKQATDRWREGAKQCCRTCEVNTYQQATEVAFQHGWAEREKQIHPDIALPKLKPCQQCGAELEYYAETVVGCKSSDCDFTKEFDQSLETPELGEKG